MQTQTQILILGAGYSGLTAAALLAKEGYAVTVLESHDTLGGCAGFYRRGKFTFDVGATTLSGLGTFEPAGRVFEHLGIQPHVLKQDLGMCIRMHSKVIHRYADQHRWIDEVSTHFPGGNQRGFWNTLEKISEEVWQLIYNKPYLMPSTIQDWCAVLQPNNLKALGMVRGLVSPLGTLLKKHKLDTHSDFIRCINEQLLISTQSTSNSAPYLQAALGLMYPANTYYPLGGMYKPALQLLRSAQGNGARICFRKKVISLAKNKNTYAVTCEDGNEYSAPIVLSSIPVWNMAFITKGKLKTYYSKLAKRYSFSWCAFTMYLAVEGNMNLEAAYIQIHLTKPIRYVHSGSVFVSISLPNDTEKAPLGCRTITVSTHTLASDWQGLSSQEYQTQKEYVSSEILQLLKQELLGLQECTMLHSQAGSSQTWEEYTGRYKGYVGGIPHTTNKPIFTLPRNQTPFSGLFAIGDTSFPGQGTPAVMLGAWNSVQRIINNYTTSVGRELN